MSTAAAEHVDSHDEEHEHPSDAKYMQIAAILAFVTALEVGTYFVDMPGEILIPLLMVMMVFKFFYVAAWFMHLRFDSPLCTKYVPTSRAVTMARITATWMYLRSDGWS